MAYGHHGRESVQMVGNREFSFEPAGVVGQHGDQAKSGSNLTDGFPELVFAVPGALETRSNSEEYSEEIEHQQCGQAGKYARCCQVEMGFEGNEGEDGGGQVGNPTVVAHFCRVKRGKEDKTTTYQPIKILHIARSPY